MPRGVAAKRTGCTAIRIMAHEKRGNVHLLLHANRIGKSVQYALNNATYLDKNAIENDNIPGIFLVPL